MHGGQRKRKRTIVQNKKVDDFVKKSIIFVGGLKKRDECGV
jgi:hypothetical protein